MLRRLPALFPLFALSLASTAPADLLYEGAVLPREGSTGSSVSGRFWVGERVFLAGTSQVDGAGAYFTDFNQNIDDVFVALVALDGPDDFPDTNDLSSEDLIDTSIVSIGPDTGDYLAPFDLVLPGGWYMIVLGRGAFGVEIENITDSRTLPVGLVDVAPQPFYSFRPSGSGFTEREDAARFLLTGVPEPGSLASGTAALAALAWLARRRASP